MQTNKAVDRALLAFSLAATMAVGARAAHLSDSAIETSIRKSAVFHQYLKEDDIKVSADDGAVTLTGTVSAEHHKALANDTAASQHGVTSVDNRLEVAANAPAPKSDAWLAMKVKSVLLFHRSVSAVKTDVDAKNGVITLRGTAETQAQKDLTGEYALDVEGVTGLQNNITLPKSARAPRRFEEKFDDSSITAQVKLTLLFHRSTSALKTHVETRDGVVTLTGETKNIAEKDLAEKIVMDVKGVKSVVNKLNVDKASTSRLER